MMEINEIFTVLKIDDEDNGGLIQSKHYTSLSISHYVHTYIEMIKMIEMIIEIIKIHTFIYRRNITHISLYLSPSLFSLFIFRCLNNCNSSIRGLTSFCSNHANSDDYQIDDDNDDDDYGDDDNKNSQDDNGFDNIMVINNDDDDDDHDADTLIMTMIQLQHDGYYLGKQSHSLL